MDWQPENWTDEGPVREAAGDAVQRSRGEGEGGGTQRRGRARRRADNRKKAATAALDLDRSALRRRLGPRRAEGAAQALARASDAFSAERFSEAARLLKPLVEQLPEEPAIRELAGLTAYRLGRWSSAVGELGAFVELTGSTEQHPVLADAHRALGHHGAVRELWEELAAASPSGPLVAEGRIVAAGSLADQGDLVGAIAMLESGQLGGGALAFHHLRMRYALADLYERVGDAPRARRLFASVVDAEPSFADAAARLANL